MTDNNSELMKLVPFQMIVDQELQRSFGFIYSSTRNSVSYPDPVIRSQVQSEVDANVQGFLIVYLFAIWEEHVSRETERDHLESDELKRLKAYRHIRHTSAHGLKGKRANLCASEFDAVMSGPEPITGVVWDQDRLDLSGSQAALDCRGYMTTLAARLITRLASNGSTVRNAVPLTGQEKQSKKDADE